MFVNLSDGMPWQDCEPGATKGKQERGAAQVDALVVAIIIMIIMYDTCHSNISGNDMYDDVGLYCSRGLKKGEELCAYLWFPWTP